MIQWTGDSMGRLIWRCLDCGQTGEAESEAGIAAGNFHRDICQQRADFTEPFRVWFGWAAVE